MGMRALGGVQMMTPCTCFAVDDVRNSSNDANGVAPALSAAAPRAGSLGSITALTAMRPAVAFAAPPPEVRGTWLTTTANDALATPAKTAETMKRLREIGLNTVYVECWKNGYTEFPSATLE